MKQNIYKIFYKVNFNYRFYSFYLIVFYIEIEKRFGQCKVSLRKRLRKLVKDIQPRKRFVPLYRVLDRENSILRL